MILAQGQFITPELIDAFAQAGVAITLAAVLIVLILMGIPWLIIMARNQRKAESDNNKTVDKLIDSQTKQSQNILDMSTAVKDSHIENNRSLTELQNVVAKMTEATIALQQTSKRAADAALAASETAGTVQESVADLRAQYIERNNRLIGNQSTILAKQDVIISMLDELKKQVENQSGCDVDALSELLQPIIDYIAKLPEITSAESKDKAA